MQEPCGTPKSMSNLSEVAPSITACWNLPDRNELQCSSTKYKLILKTPEQYHVIDHIECRAQVKEDQ